MILFDLESIQYSRDDYECSAEKHKPLVGISAIEENCDTIITTLPKVERYHEF